MSSVISILVPVVGWGKWPTQVHDRLSDAGAHPCARIWRMSERPRPPKDTHNSTSPPQPSAESAPLYQHGAKPHEPCHHRTEGLKARPIPTSIPKVALVKLDTVLPQESPKLVLEVLFGMMLLLRIDIRDQGIQIRRPNRERPITALPREFSKPSTLHPL